MEPGGDVTGAFDAAWSLAEDVPGWLTRQQASVLWEEARALAPGARIVEVGTHEGRSAVVLASVPHIELTCIDPFPVDWRYGAQGTRQRLASNLERAGVAGRVRVLETTSADARATWSEPVALVYIDGKHDALTVLDDLRWAAHLPPGGRLLLHDAFSSLGVTLAVLRLLGPAAALRYRGRTGSLAVFDVATPTARDRWRILAETPWWTRNLVVKVLLRLRLGAVAARLGHHDDVDPY